MTPEQIFNDVDARLRATVKSIGSAYLADPVAGNMATCCLVPAICAMLEELARLSSPELSREWAKCLYRTADKLASNG